MFNLAISATLALAAAAHAQQYLMVVDSGTPERVALVDPATGAIADLNFIVETTGGPFVMDTPKEALRVGDEIWVSDQAADAIFRFSASATPAYLGQIGGGATGGLDNIRGMGVVGDRVYVCNSGLANGAPGPALVVFDFAGNRITSFPTGVNTSPFDAIEFQGRILISDSTTDDLTLYNTDGTLHAIFHDSSTATDIAFPQQLLVANTGPAGAQEVWAAGFSPPIGIYRYDATGAQVAAYGVGAPRGLAFLDSGELLHTVGAAVRAFLPPAGAPFTLFSLGSAQYANILDLTPTCVADIDDGSGTGTPDGGVDISDLLYYLFLFDAGDLDADVDDGSSTGTPDGGVDISDLLYFLVRFDAGC